MFFGFFHFLFVRIERKTKKCRWQKKTKKCRILDAYIEIFDTFKYEQHEKQLDLAIDSYIIN